MFDGGSVPESDVVVEAVELVASLDADGGLEPLRELAAPDEGKPGIPGIVAEPVSGDLFRICSSWRWLAVRSLRPSDSLIAGSWFCTRCSDALARSGSP